MIYVYKLQADGDIAIHVGMIRKPREIGDKIRLKSCLYTLYVIGKGPATRQGGDAVYCVYKDELNSVKFNEKLFGYK